MKGLRVAGAHTLEQANAYLETEFVAWWNQTLAVVPANAADAHRLWVIKTPSVAESTTCGGVPVSPRCRFPRAAWRCNIVTSPLKSEH